MKQTNLKHGKDIYSSLSTITKQLETKTCTNQSSN